MRSGARLSQFLIIFIPTFMIWKRSDICFTTWACWGTLFVGHMFYFMETVGHKFHYMEFLGHTFHENRNSGALVS